MISNDLQILQLLRLVSPALPVGAFAYSQGLEGGVEQGWIQNDQDSLQWISGVLQNSIANLDLPALYWQKKMIENNEIEAFYHLNDCIFAYRETSEFRLESHQMGQALLRLLRDTQSDVNVDASGVVHTVLYDKAPQQIDWVSAFAIAASSVKLSDQQALLGYAWAWCETQVAAAIKLVPLGQTQGQKLLINLTETIATLVEDLLANMPDKDKIGAISPNLAIISSLHETQYSRLFRS